MKIKEIAYSNGKMNELIKKLISIRDIGIVNYRRDLETINSVIKELNRFRWIPIKERLPENDRYILMSFANAYMPQIGRYENGSFYPDDDDRSCESYGLMVDAWMELPGCMDFPRKEK